MSIRRTSLLLLFGLSFVLIGCAVNQDKEIAAYRQVVDLTSPASTQPAMSLSLRDAMLLANEQNENLSIQGEQYLRTIIARRQAVANFLPTVNLAPTYSFREKVDDSNKGNDNGGGSGSSSQQDEFLDVPIDTSLNLFNGFRDINQYWRDTYLIQRQRNVLLAQQESLLLDVAQVYYQILRSEESVRVLENSLKVQEERLRDTRGRFEAGVARSLDVAQTEAQVSATRITLIRARNDVKNARALLALVTNGPVKAAELTDQYIPPDTLQSLDQYNARAEEYREELGAVAAAVEAARHEIQVAFGQYYPSLSLDFSVFLYRESVPDERHWDALLSANLPIFAAGRIRADVREAWSFMREALLAQSYQHRQVRQEVETAYQDFIASQARLAELKIALAASQQAFEQAEQSYRAGLATNLDRIIAQNALLDAQLAEASEEFDLKVFYLRLLRATGTLREML